MATLLGEDILGVDILGTDIYGEEELHGEDILGADIYGEDMLGVDWAQVAASAPAGSAANAAFQAYRKRQAAKRAAARQGYNMQIRKAPPLINQVPGVSAPAQVKIPLGFGTASLAPVALAANGTISGSATATPQVPVRGGRLILQRQDSGTSACPVLLTNVLVGQQSVFASAQGVPVEAFSATATDTVLTIPAAQPGVVITAQYQLTNTTGASLTGTCSISGVLFCDSMV